ncbi:MAG: hypothetical protein HC817_08160 [Saprospiraceae bacterium]|nr:hypothetical protein [Saprospiraceae bacterium]
MKNTTLIIGFMLALCASSCVQKSSNKTITFVVDVSKVKDVKTVGLRGKEKPLSWRKDFAMTPLKKTVFTRHP